MGECSSREYSLTREVEAFVEKLEIPSTRLLSFPVKDEYLSYIKNKAQSSIAEILSRILVMRKYEREIIADDLRSLCEKLEIPTQYKFQHFFKDKIPRDEIFSGTKKLRDSIQFARESILETRSKIKSLISKKRWYHHDLVFEIRDNQTLLKFKIDRYFELRDAAFRWLRCYVEEIFLYRMDCMMEFNSKKKLFVDYGFLFPLENVHVRRYISEVFSSPPKEEIDFSAKANRALMCMREMIKIIPSYVLNYDKEIRDCRNRMIDKIKRYKCNENHSSAFYEESGLEKMTFDVGEKIKIPIEDYCIFCHHPVYSKNGYFLHEQSAIADAPLSGNFPLLNFLLKKVILKEYFGKQK